MDRLSKYAASESAALQRLLSMGAFGLFQDIVAKVLDAQPGMAASDAVEMFAALMAYSAAVHPSDTATVNKVLAAAHAALSRRPTPVSGDARAERALVALLTVPLQK